MRAAHILIAAFVAFTSLAQASPISPVNDGVDVPGRRSNAAVEASPAVALPSDLLVSPTLTRRANVDDDDDDDDPTYPATGKHWTLLHRGRWESKTPPLAPITEEGEQTNLSNEQLVTTRRIRFRQGRDYLLRLKANSPVKKITMKRRLNDKEIKVPGQEIVDPPPNADNTNRFDWRFTVPVDASASFEITFDALFLAAQYELIQESDISSSTSSGSEEGTSSWAAAWRKWRSCTLGRGGDDAQREEVRRLAC